MKSYYSAWRQSLRMLRPEEFKFLLMVSCASLMRLVFTLQRLWWIACIMVMAIFFSGYGIFGALSYGVASVLAALLMRPSVGLKDAYYTVYKAYGLFCSALFLFFPQILGPFFLITTFFFLDSYGTIEDFIKSCKRAIIFSLYQLPLLMIMIVVFWIVVYGMSAWYLILIKIPLFLMLISMVGVVYKKQLYGDIAPFSFE